MKRQLSCPAGEDFAARRSGPAPMGRPHAPYGRCERYPRNPGSRFDDTPNEVKNMKRMMIRALLCALGLCLLLCSAALAYGAQVSVSYLKPDGSFANENCTTFQSMDRNLTNGWFCVPANTIMSIADPIYVVGDANLVLMDDAELNAEGGIVVRAGNSLTIWAQSNGQRMGRLNATGYSSGSVTQVAYGAGIGGLITGAEREDAAGTYEYTYFDFGSITINGGHIVANGAERCAGIGAAFYEGSEYPSTGKGTVTINGGFVEAAGGEGGAGIGGGESSLFKSITITGGNVTASAQLGQWNWYGAALGVGAGGGSITITGGSVSATGTNDAHDIKTGGAIAISGGTVSCGGSRPITAGAGLTISGGTVGTAGLYISGCQATLSNGTVTVGDEGVFISAGTSSGGMTVSGGTINANASSTGVVVASDATLSVTGGEINALNAGIQVDSGAVMTVSGGTINAQNAGIYGDETYSDINDWGRTVLTWQPTGNGGVPSQPRISAGSFTGVVELGNRFQKTDRVFPPTSRADNAALAGSTLVPTALYCVTAGSTSNGSISVNPLFGAQGDHITVTVMPDTGYVLDTLTAGGQPIAAQQGSYSFALPGSDVTVDASFKPEPISYYDPLTGTSATCDDFTWLHDLSDPAVLTGGWYAVKNTVTVSDRISVSGDVHLILCDSAALTASAGINVTGSDGLTIWAQSTGDYMGRLDADGGEESAGIGGGKDQPGGHITINGGQIVACGGPRGAGIGGGARLLGDSGDGGYITLNSGQISAFGGDWGAGIGGGWRGNGGDIVIGGDARIEYAYGGSCGAGIGGGDNGSGGNITIQGNAWIGEAAGFGETTGLGGAGIGGGSQGDGGTITITGGTIEAANGGINGAGIGGGSQGDGGTITITGGTVHARGDQNEGARYGGGAGIGGGGEGTVDLIAISGGAITAKGGAYAAGIGGGRSENGGVIRISGGTVIANGGDGGTAQQNIGIYGSGAGIGGGRAGNAGDIAITGGNVTARGGIYAMGIGRGADNGGGGVIQLGWSSAEGGAVPAQPVIDTFDYDYTAMNPDAPFTACDANGSLIAVLNSSYPEDEVLTALCGRVLVLRPTAGYAIHVDGAIENGRVVAPGMGAADSEIVLRLEPDESYALKPGTLSVTSGGQALALTRKTQAIYTFRMPVGEVSVTAQFEPGKLVIFQNHDGTELQRGYFSDGDLPVYLGDTPRRSSDDAHYDFVFSGWEPGIAPVNGAPATYTAQYRTDAYHLMRYMVNAPESPDVYRVALIDRIPVGSTTYTVTDWEPRDANAAFDGWQLVADDGNVAVCHAAETVDNIGGDLEFASLWKEGEPDPSSEPDERNPSNVTIRGMGEVFRRGDVYTANPYEGNRFVCWKGTTSYRNPDLLYVLSESPVLELTRDVYNLTAVFEGAVSHSVTVESIGYGTATASHTACTEGTIVNLTVTPDDGYSLVRWDIRSGNVRIVNDRFFMPDADVSIRAIFGMPPDFHSITVDGNIVHGSITAPEFAREGSAVSITLRPESFEYKLAPNSLSLMCEGAAVPYTLEGATCTFDMPEGDVSITARFEKTLPSYLDVTDGGTVERLCEEYGVISAGTGEWGRQNETTWYVAADAVEIGGRVVVHGAVNLILCDGAVLRVPLGITVPADSSLTIYAQSTGSDMGALIVERTQQTCAGIGGGGMREGSGALTICGGRIRAVSGTFSAAIGCSYQGTSTTVTIRGGEVYAESRANTAAIGGGQMSENYNRSNISITITGGTVTAVKTNAVGTGIGSGLYLTDGSLNITITGGNVTARSGSGSFMAIGGTTAYPGTLTLGDVAVRASESQASPVAAENRIETCHGTSALIGPCPHSFSYSACVWCGREEVFPAFDAADFTKLPAGLRTIEDEAFKSMPLTAVDASGCSFLGEGAFRGCVALTRIRLPGSCQIAESAFEGCSDQLIIYAPTGGTTEQWAVAHGFRFAPQP